MKSKLLAILSTTKDSLGRLLGKVNNGKSDIRTAIEASPYGIDSNPIKGMVAIYMRTEQDGREVLMGYLNKNRLADVGELRLFSTDSEGTEKMYMWLTNDGFMELGGDSNFAVKFNELKTEFNSLKSSYNDLVTKFNAHVHPVPGVTVGGGATTSSVTGTQGTANAANIDTAKNEKIKTIG